MLLLSILIEEHFSTKPYEIKGSFGSLLGLPSRSYGCAASLVLDLLATS
jgi:hypothetical protein